jgi:5'-3' exonuclease
LRPTKVIIFFDGKGGSSLRREVHSEYKEGRRPPTVIGRMYNFSSQEKADQNRAYQFRTLQNLLEFLPVNVMVSSGYETDDGIAYAIKHRNYFKLGPCTIVSCDRDFYQLIGSDVSIYNPMSKKLINSESVLSEFGIHPKHWLFYRSITGDKSDNIDGVKSFGPKTLLKMFSLEDAELDAFTPEDIEGLMMASDMINDKTTMKRISLLHENKSKIERNWKLMSLADPMISNSGEQHITERIEGFKGHFKKLDLYREFVKLGLGLNPTVFDDFKFLQ